MNEKRSDENSMDKKPLTHGTRNEQQVILLSTYRISPPFNSNTKEEYDPPLTSLMSRDDETGD